MYFLAVLPFLVINKGLFFYYGDYNVQQVPFLIFAHRAVREGRFFWNPLVDLGGNMGGCFAFYLWGSPFFWLTIPFPEEWLPYLMPYLMALKSGTASLAAYLWIRTQTKADRAAVAGALLYAFSGFQACNIVFQHFHDATAFFPLYLLSFDGLVAWLRERPSVREGALKPREDTLSRAEGICSAGWHPLRSPQADIPPRVERRAARTGQPFFFILMTALMSVINYYFFFGQALFLILYYFIRWWGAGAQKTDSSARTAVRETALIAGAGAAGLLLASFFLVQAVQGILGNTRVSKMLSGYDLVAYPDSTTPLAILKSLFMTPDLVARGTVFTSDNIRNGSLAFCLPCFAMAGVFAYWMLRNRDWKKTILGALGVCAFVPVLGAAFSALNSNFYARWYYMPVLLCACMTAQALEEDECAAFTKGAVLSGACTVLFILLCFLPVYEKGSWSFTSIGENRELLTAQIRCSLFNTAMLAVVTALKRFCPDLFGTKRRDSERIPLRPEGRRPFSSRETPDPSAPEPPSQGTSKPLALGSLGILRGNLLCPGALVLLVTAFSCIVSFQAVLHNGSSLISRTGFEKWKRQMLTERPFLGEDGSGAEGDAAMRTAMPVPGEAALGGRVLSDAREDGPAAPGPPFADADLRTDEGISVSGEGGGAPFCRVETGGTSTNYEMVWGYPTMHCFESTVHPSIFAWYRGIGMIRTVESTLPFERIGARAVMSVRYYLENALVKSSNSYTDQGGLRGYKKLNGRNGYDVYETENYIPMGFCFDSYMTEEHYRQIENGKTSDRVLVKDLILPGETAEKYAGLMEEDVDTDPGEMPYREFQAHCEERKKSACTEFGFDRNGWHARAKMEKDNLVLFSIPYDEGFTVRVDGGPAELERADYGLCAVFVPKGEHEIRASYLPKGFAQSAAVSLAAAAFLLAAAFSGLSVGRTARKKTNGRKKNGVKRQRGNRPQEKSQEKIESDGLQTGSINDNIL